MFLSFKIPRIMKNLILFCLFLSSCFSIKAQDFGNSGEFGLFENGLIYSDTTINQLKRVVDSLNLKHAVCSNSPDYYSQLQSTGYVVSSDMSEKKIKEIISDNPSLENLKKLDKSSEIGDLQVFVISEYQNYREEKIKSIDGYDIEGHHATLRFIDEEIKSVQNWVFYPENSTKTKMICLMKPFESSIMNIEIARKVQYSDCLIDTNETKIFEDAEQGYVSMPKNYHSLSHKEKTELLEEMRSTRVVGMCSMDSSPRVHAKDIAVLAAETVNWGVFLRSHLDIMNDKFHRVSDGSYAYERRNTYIKELEEINIDVVSLLIGTSLRIQNPPRNHYYANVGRTGRAIAESEDLDQFEKTIIALIGSTKLDLFNRLIMVYLYETIINFTEDESAKKEMTKKIEAVKSDLTAYLEKL